MPASYLYLPTLLSTFAVLESAMAILDAFRPGIHGTTHPEVLQSAIPILAPAVELAALEHARASIPLLSVEIAALDHARASLPLPSGLSVVVEGSPNVTLDEQMSDRRARAPAVAAPCL